MAIKKGQPPGLARQLSLDQRRVKLRLWRPVAYPATWAVEDAGTDYDCYAIDQAGPGDPNWSHRAFCIDLAPLREKKEGN